MSKSKSTKKFPYDELHDFVRSENAFLMQTILGLVTLGGVVAFIIFILFFIIFQYSIDETWERVYIVVALTSLGIVITLIFGYLIGMNTNKCIHHVLKKLNRSPDVFTTIEIDNLVERARIGNNTGSLNTLLPLLVIPLLVSFTINNLAQFYNVDMYPAALLSMFIVALAYKFFYDLDKANTDAVIQHAISEYRKEQRSAHAIKQTMTGEGTTPASIENEQECPNTNVIDQREAATLRMLHRYSTVVHQRPSQQSVASTNGVGTDDKAARRPSNGL